MPFWAAALKGIAGLAAAKASAPKPIDESRIAGYQQPTQNLINQQLKTANEMQDPHSDINLGMRRLMAQRSYESGAQASSQAGKLAAQEGISQGQAAMQQQMGMHQATSGVNQQWLQNLMQQRGAGAQMMQNMTQMQQGMGDKMSNVYMANRNMMNKNPMAGGGAGMLMGANLLSGLMGQYGGGTSWGGGED